LLNKNYYDIIFEINNKKPYYIEFVKNEVLNMMILLCRYIHETPDQKSTEQHSKKNIAISIENYISENCSGDCTLENLAKELFMSRRQLSRLVYKFYSRSFRRLLLETRMSKAQWLLEKNSMSLSEIAEKTGYSTATSFCRAYAGFYGMTPMEYKNKQVKTEVNFHEQSEDY
jgi:transcriptional regulator GlxA family with amidase domain